MLQNLKNFLHQVVPGRKTNPTPGTTTVQTGPALKAVGFAYFLNIDFPPREMLLSPILPERSLAMLYAPRGIGKSWLGLSIGMAVAAGAPLLRWHVPRQGMRDLFQAVPESIFKADAGLVTIDNDRVLDDRGLAG